jgi:Tfp pilus assembly protein PilV
MSAKSSNRGSLSAQRGFSLTEALLAFLVASFAILALVRANSAVVASAADGKVQTEALRLAEQKVEQLRNIDTLAAYQALASSATAENLIGTNTNFSRTWTVTKVSSSGSPAYADVTVDVTWQDSDGIGRTATLRSRIAETRPEKTGQWYVAAAAIPPTSGEPLADNADEPQTGGGGGQGGEGETTPPPDGGDDVSDADDSGGTGDEDGGVGAPEGSSCTSKEIVGTVTASGQGQAHKLTISSISGGDCSDVTGNANEASFSCYVGCTGTVILTFDTSQDGATVSPANRNIVLDAAASPMAVTVTVQK